MEGDLVTMGRGWGGVKMSGNPTHDRPSDPSQGKTDLAKPPESFTFSLNVQISVIVAYPWTTSRHAVFLGGDEG